MKGREPGRPAQGSFSGDHAITLGCAMLAPAIVAALAAFLPRRYMVNDDQTITAFLRENTLAPYIEPVLSQALGACYARAPGWPWFGLWLYLVYAATLALGARILLDGPADAPPSLRRALVVGVFPTIVGIAALSLRVTFTTAAIAACGIALVGLAAQALRAAEGEAERPLRNLACGLLLAAGCATRSEALSAAGVATLPLLVAAGWRGLRALRLPGVRWLAAGLLPALVLHGAGWLAPQSREPAARRYLAFSAERGALQLRAAFVGLDRRAPQVLKAAGWDERHYRRFERWMYLDEDWYTAERLRALRETGGLPKDIAAADAVEHARAAAGYGFALLLAAVAAAGGIALSGLGRRRALVLGLFHLGALMVAAVVLQRFLRFPVRVALPMSLVAAAAVWIAVRDDCVAGDWARAGARLRSRPLPAAAAGLIVAVTLLFAFVSLSRARPRAPAPDPERLELERRILQSRPALVVVHAQAGWSRDPLRARPRDYPYLSLDWDIFSVPFYRALGSIGGRRGQDLVPSMAGADHLFFLCERRFLGDLVSMVEEDAPGSRLVSVQGTGPTPDDLVLLRIGAKGPPSGP